ncbi:MAG: hypothetical protein MZU97_02575 [Bacillus subtilis]|nr:hypothetical protein [Bacillus subtilis]
MLDASIANHEGNITTLNFQLMHVMSQLKDIKKPDELISVGEFVNNQGMCGMGMGMGNNYSKTVKLTAEEIIALQEVMKDSSDVKVIAEGLQAKGLNNVA